MELKITAFEHFSVSDEDGDKVMERSQFVHKKDQSLKRVA